MKLCQYLLLLSLILLSSCMADTKEYRDYSSVVNPFIGTGSDGHTFPGVVAPFGMVQLSPDTRTSHSDYASGYHYNDSTILGFSHTRYSGTGRGSGGDILFMPTSGKVQLVPGDAGNSTTGYRSSFSHKNESATAGYYRVLLDDCNITAELTTSKRVGFHKYSYHSGDTANVILDLSHGISDKPDSLYLKITGENRIEGFRKSLGGLRDFQTLYFAAKFSEPFANYGVRVNGLMKNKTDVVSGKDLQAFFRFPGSKEVMIKVAISKVDIEGARKNLTEIEGWDFDKARDEARVAWNRELSKIEVKSSDTSLDTIFYTALYHSCIMPSLDMDIDGGYRSSNNKIYTAANFVDYTNFSLWDTFRALHPLMTIINREKTNDFINTFIERYENSGGMPIFELSGNDLLVMIGYHSLPVIADAYVKRIRGYNTKKALEGMISLADMPFEERNEYKTFGFIPYEYTDQAVSRSLEYAYDDWCITRLAKDIDEKAFNHFNNRSGFYRNLFDIETCFMRAKNTSYQWETEFNPLAYTRRYTQGNAWQYTTFVSQDIHGLIELMGGNKKFENWLDRYFTTENSSTYQGRQSSMMIGQYYHGNEPSHHTAYLYNYAGVPWKTQEITRKIMNSQYNTSPEGLAGNDDAGQMSAWYVLSSMGFYSVTPGLAYYVIGSPLFDSSTINLENGKSFSIIAKNNSKENVYIQSVTLNGKPYTKSYLKHADIIAGGTMVFEMGNSPNKAWATDRNDCPYSPNYKSSPMPQVVVEDKQIGRDGVVTFEKSCNVSLMNIEDSDVFYTLDGNDPDKNSAKFNGKIKIDKTCSLKVKAFKKGLYPGYTTTVKFRNLEPVKSKPVSNLTQGISFEYRETGVCKKVAQIDQYPIVKEGILDVISSETSFKQKLNHALTFNGYVKIPKSGVYTFYANTEFGIALWVDGVLLASNESTDWLGERSGTIGLQKGYHTIRVKYFQLGGETDMSILWEGPGIKKSTIPKKVYFH